MEPGDAFNITDPHVVQFLTQEELGRLVNGVVVFAPRVEKVRYVLCLWCKKKTLLVTRHSTTYICHRNSDESKSCSAYRYIVDANVKEASSF